MAGGALPKMKLWYYPQYRSTRCMWLVAELGIEKNVEYAYLDMQAGTTPEREEYRKKIHPINTIPALEIEGRPPILESGAICLYLADLCGKLVPELKDRSEYYNWVMYSSCTMDTVMENLTQEWIMKTPDKQNPDIIAKARADTDRCLDVLEKELTGKDYILGKELTAADCIIGYNVIWAGMPEMDNGVLLKGRPNLKAYLDRIMARPALKGAMAIGKQ